MANVSGVVLFAGISSVAGVSNGTSVSQNAGIVAYVSSSGGTWILAAGTWNDAGIWDDSAVWID